MYDLHDLEVLLRAKTPMLFCESSDEQRVTSLLSRCALSLGKDAWRWTCIEGLSRLSIDSKPQISLAEPYKLLHHLRTLTTPGVFALLDFHHYLDEPKNIRLLKEIALTSNELNHTLVFISHEIEIPEELSPFSSKYTFSSPSLQEITQIIKEELQKYLATSSGEKVIADKESVKLLIHSLRGFPEVDVRRLARTAICDDGAVTSADVQSVLHAKKTLLQRDGVLEFEYDTANFEQVAGLTQLKTWLSQRKQIMQGVLPKDSKLTPPKGVLLLGVQGCGKSLAAKAIAGSWSLPLLRLDMGAVFNKFMGETERRIRDALKNSEALAPCILWIDELEKGIASTDFDGGTAQRVLGTLLTWMAERQAPVFLVATAKNIEALPPELLRKGRFDEVFFIDLPNASVREELFRIHLTARELSLANFEMPSLVACTDGFSGAEIEQLIVSAMYAARSQLAQGGLISTELLLAEANRTRPLSKLMAEQINNLRSWAKERCVFAD